MRHHATIARPSRTGSTTLFVARFRIASVTRAGDAPRFGKRAVPWRQALQVPDTAIGKVVEHRALGQPGNVATDLFSPGRGPSTEHCATKARVPDQVALKANPVPQAYSV